jgi:hypothetical protein
VGRVGWSSEYTSHSMSWLGRLSLICPLDPKCESATKRSSRKKIVPVRIRRLEMAPLDGRDDDIDPVRLLRPHWGATSTTGGAHSSPPARAFAFRINKLLTGLPA